jgi:hypothetical protein
VTSFRDGPKDQTSDVQLHIRESRDSGFDASHRPGMTLAPGRGSQVEMSLPLDASLRRIEFLRPIERCTDFSDRLVAVLIQPLNFFLLLLEFSDVRRASCLIKLG